MHELVEQITDIVMKRLKNAEFGIPESPPVSSDSMNLALLFVSSDFLNDDSLDEIVKLGDIAHFTVFASPELPTPSVEGVAQRIKGRFYPLLPSNWKGMVSSFDSVVILGGDTGFCAKLSTLISDEIPLKITVQSLFEQKSIFIVSKEMAFLRSISSKLPKMFFKAVSENYEKILSFGIKEVSLASLSGELASCRGRGRQSFSPGSGGVVTKDDIEIAVKGGEKILYFRVGTIITPLARDYADNAGIEIVLK